VDKLATYARLSEMVVEMRSAAVSHRVLLCWLLTLLWPALTHLLAAGPAAPFREHDAKGRDRRPACCKCFRKQKAQAQSGR
jgi:hypothetical protein